MSSVSNMIKAMLYNYYKLQQLCKELLFFYDKNIHSYESLLLIETLKS